MAPRDCPPRYATPRTPERETLGTAAARIAEKLGTPLMPWQRQVLDTALEVETVEQTTHDGQKVRGQQFVYREVIVTVPRQSGKTTSVLSLILARALHQAHQRIIYTAQSRADARKKWSEDWLPILDASPFSNFYSTRKANGDESLIFGNGSRQGLVAGTKKSGHGSTLDMAVIDEAFAQADARLEQALKPAMVTRNKLPCPGAQLWVVSTAGTFALSPYLWDKVEKGREIAQAGLNKSVAYFEWSAGEDDDPSDEDTWWRCMPALGRTATLEAVRADFMSMELHEFQRAYLNQWTSIAVDPVIPIADWSSLADQQLDTTGVPVVVAIDVAPDRSRTSVAGSGLLSSGKSFVEVIAHRPGVEWAAPFVENLTNNNDVHAVIIDPASPSINLVRPLSDRGVNAQQITPRELGEACQGFFDDVVEHKVTHLNQQSVTTALDGAVKRNIGDGGWGWGRRNSGTDISPLVACTLAHWGLSTSLGEAPEVWDLNEIVAKLRGEQVGEVTQAAGPSPPPDEDPSGVFITPI